MPRIDLSKLEEAIRRGDVPPPSNYPYKGPGERGEVTEAFISPSRAPGASKKERMNQISRLLTDPEMSWIERQRLEEEYAQLYQSSRIIPGGATRSEDPYESIAYEKTQEERRESYRPSGVPERYGPGELTPGDIAAMEATGTPAPPITPPEVGGMPSTEFPTGEPTSGYRWEFDPTYGWIEVPDPTAWQREYTEREHLRESASERAKREQSQRELEATQEWRQWQIEQAQRETEQEEAWRQQQVTASREQQEADLEQQQRELEAMQEWRQWQISQAEQAAQVQQQNYLAQLGAHPRSWLEYSAAAEQTPAIQPWMQPLMSGQYQGMQAGQAMPGWSGTDMSNMPELLRPSRQYQARMTPSSREQHLGYEQARTGATPEDVQWRQWSSAPPSGRNAGLRRIR